MRLMLPGISLNPILAAGLLVFHVTAQRPTEKFSHPPISFSAEDEHFPNEVPLPDCVRLLLATDRQVIYRLNYANLSPDQLPTNWFTASELDIGWSKGRLLVVMGADGMRGANINPFWVFRRSASSCDLLLTVGAHDVELLNTKTDGLPDIRIDAATAARYSENWFNFDGQTYREVRRTAQPIGDEVPRDLTGFETRSPLVQGIGESPSPILSEARAWLWQQWRLEKPSYMRVTLHSLEGDQTTVTYFIRKSDSSLDVMIQIHRIMADRNPHFGVPRPMVEDEIEVAENVERRVALRNDADRSTKLPKDQEAPPGSYELYFSDASGKNVGIL